MTVFIPPDQSEAPGPDRDPDGRVSMSDQNNTFLARIQTPVSLPIIMQY